MRWLCLVLCCVWLLSGCTAVDGAMIDARMATAGFAVGDGEASGSPVPQPATKAAAGAPAAPGQPAAGRADRMLVYRGAVTVEVIDAAAATATFLAAIEQLGGHLSSQRGTTVVVRVPAAQFEAAYKGLCGMGRVLDESREANDVTDEFTDVAIRIDNARKARERLLALLEKADKVEDMLKIEEQLRRLTEEIERLEGKKKLLADQVALATLSATFASVAPTSPRPTSRASAFEWMRHLGADRLLRRQR